MNRVLITGGAGLIGSHIADLLIQDSDPEIIVLDNFVRGRLENLSWAIANGRLRIVEGDIRDTRLLREVMEGVDVVFHQAAIRITQCAEEPAAGAGGAGRRDFQCFGGRRSSRVPKVVAASSASVYGLAEEFPTTESHHPYNNRTLYGAAKVFNEGHVAQLSRHVRPELRGVAVFQRLWAAGWTFTGRTPKC